MLAIGAAALLGAAPAHPALAAPARSVVAHVVRTAAVKRPAVGPDDHATFAPEASIALPRTAAPPSPTFLGAAFVRSPGGRLVTKPVRHARRVAALDSTSVPANIYDTYLQDGSETALAISGSDPANVLAAYNEGWDFDPDVPLSTVTSAAPWKSDVFPTGSGVYAGYPYSPWAVAGNAPGEFFSSEIRHDLYPSDNTHVILAHSLDGGQTFTNAYEVPRTVLQDRAMFDVDRNQTRGGTSGVFDGRIYLTYDDWGLGGGTYSGSWLQILSPGIVATDSVQLSGTGTPAYLGAQFQPVAGINDGQVFLASTSVSSTGSTCYATFHELTNGGATRTLGKSTLAWAPAGQQLGASTHRGVDGHRIDEHGFLDVDRSHGPRRGYLYFITNRNPNPTDPSQDQGDLYLSVSVTRGSSWETAKIPTHSGYTQYFPMMDVDDQGWIHIAYYENTTGAYDAGVLNASRADVWYSVSRDGGTSWTPPVRVNLDADALSYEDPPNELGSFDYYLLGDYMQLQATGVGAATAAYVAWTGYNQYRADDDVGTKKERVYASRVAPPTAPGWTPLLGAAMAASLACAGALALRRRAPASARR